MGHDSHGLGGAVLEDSLCCFDQGPARIAYIVDAGAAFSPSWMLIPALNSSHNGYLLLHVAWNWIPGQLDILSWRSNASVIG